MNIRLSSTSYLLSENRGWKFLEENHKILYSNFGEVFAYKKQKKDSKFCDIKIFFISDLVDIYLDNKNLSLKKIMDICNLIKRDLSTNKMPFLICVSSYEYFNIIENSKNKNLNEEIKQYFLNYLYKISKKFKNLYIIDIDKIFADYGLKKCFDKRNYHLCRCRLSYFGIEILSKNLKKILDRINKPNQKILLLDCDNTLWGGVIGEDGFDKILISNEGIGFAFYEFQKAVKKLKNQGVIIVLLSKNNQEDVLNVFKKKNMPLKLDDITAYKINWKEKSSNIIQISKDLNLGLDSFVFWDDNPLEREKVKLNLKQIKVIEPDQDISNWANQLLEFEGFSRFYVTQSDINKTQQYKQRTKFIDNKTKFRNENDYLKSIKLKPTIHELKSKNLDRTVQMFKKTNQFNLSSKRYDYKDIALMKNNYKFYLISLRDIYGDHGIIGLISLKIVKNNFVFVDSFLLSCRVLGRYLENWILSKIFKIAKKNKSKSIFIEYKKTQRNNITKDFLLKNGFKKIDNNLNKKYKNFFSSLMDKDSKLFTINTNKKIEKLNIYGSR
tara:strand:+ start:5595 stop:7256 length:1662 start_codon:yes stop_codon:yes gene_type:complete